MGNLQSLLGECEIGEMPAYMKDYISQAESHISTFTNKNSGGDEAYIVYAESSSLPNSSDTRSRNHHHNSHSHRNGSSGVDPFRFTGPNHAYVDMKSKAHKNSNDDADADKKLLSDIVDLVVDGIDSPIVRKDGQTDDAQEVHRSIPGGDVYELPRNANNRQLKTDLWEEAQSRAVAHGPVRTSPLDEDREGNDSEDPVGAYNITQESQTSLEPELNLQDEYADEYNPLEREEYEEIEEPVVEIVKKEKSEKRKKKKKRKKKMVELSDEETTVQEPEEEEEEEEEATKEAEAENAEADGDFSGSGDGEESSPVSSPLDTCRQEEIELRSICHIVAFPFEMDEESEKIEKWYIVEAEWFRQWSKFLQGAARPGPIVNEKLLTEDNDRPWPGLEPGNHYFGMDETAWNALADRYGADLAICRKTYDVYE